MQYITARIKLYFPTLCCRSVDLNSVVHSWDSSVMYVPDVMLNKVLFLEQLSISYIREIWLTDREQSKVFKEIFVVFLCATHSFIFVINAKLVHRR